MKCTLTEETGCFGFDLEPENAAEIVALARFGLGRTKELRYAEVHFRQDNTAFASIVIGKKHNSKTSLP